MAEVYFEWLVAVVSSAELASEEMIKQANTQLFQIIYILGCSVQMDKKVQLIAPYNWQALFLSFDKKLNEMQRIVDRGDKDLI